MAAILPRSDLATCEICKSRLSDQTAYHGYINHPQLHYVLCEPCALDYIEHLTPALAIVEAQRIVKAHQLLIGGAK